MLRRGDKRQKDLQDKIVREMTTTFVNGRELLYRIKKCLGEGILGIDGAAAVHSLGLDLIASLSLY